MGLPFLNLPWMMSACSLSNHLKIEGDVNCELPRNSPPCHSQTQAHYFKTDHLDTNRQQSQNTKCTLMYVVVQKHPILLINCIYDFVRFLPVQKMVHTPTKSDFDIAVDGSFTGNTAIYASRVSAYN